MNPRHRGIQLKIAKSCRLRIRLKSAKLFMLCLTSLKKMSNNFLTTMTMIDIKHRNESEHQNIKLLHGFENSFKHKSRFTVFYDYDVNHWKYKEGEM